MATGLGNCISKFKKESAKTQLKIGNNIQKQNNIGVQVLRDIKLKQFPIKSKWNTNINSKAVP